MKIRYILLQNNNNVCFTILDMDERFRSNGDEDRKIFESSNGFKVMSCNQPEIVVSRCRCYDSSDERLIYLRGALRKKDSNMCTMELANCKDARQYVKDAHTA